ncbi:hypothetical protein M9H77_01296 [Catharanthus roseus]|uniref:Uncharacterized protein n=1 Tax=Catharanthus roseus TaxID=4058 RepID=A0ACC0C5F7_CATRO|nr:hypothetical protein M9H77_01296 [Catharanthus roseus]
MASFLFFYLLFSSSFLLFACVISQPPLNHLEQESVYSVLESINSETPWRSLFPDDLCSSAPHGVVCDYFTDQTGAVSAHIIELNFGYVSDYSPNPSCSSSATLDAFLFSSFTHLKKLFFYQCFVETNVIFPDFSSLGASLEYLVFVENPSLVGSLSGKISSLTSLRRLVITGTSVSGQIPDEFSHLINLEQLTLSRNKFSGNVSVNFEKIKKLKVLDLSQNGFEGYVPESIGNGLNELLKLDLSFNQFSGKIPENLKGLQRLKFLDLSYNRFGNFGVPLFLGEMPNLKEVYLSGNLLGGKIPEMWEKLGGILGIGLSGTGLVGNIPASMGVYLRNTCYLALDNNSLEGTVPEEFSLLESVSELNLENNNLTGKVPFSAKFVGKMGDKLKLEGNSELCIDEELRNAKVGQKLGQLKICKKPDIPQFALLQGSASSSQHLSASHFLICIGILIVLSL